MNTICHDFSRLAAFALLATLANAAETQAPMTAKDLAAKLDALQQDGSSFVRLTMEVKPSSGSPKTTLQLQIKRRRSAASTEVVYQILWPKPRAGEAVLLRQSAGGAASGTCFTPPNTMRPLAEAQMKEPLFGSDLTLADVLEDFFAWHQQTFAGTESVDHVECQILESKPGKGQHSAYGSVRTWVDLRRMVPMRIEKFLPSGTLARRIDTTRVTTDDRQRQIPAEFTVTGTRTNSATDLSGSRINHGVSYANSTFTADGLKDLSVPRSE